MTPTTTTDGRGLQLTTNRPEWQRLTTTSTNQQCDHVERACTRGDGGHAHTIATGSVRAHFTFTLPTFETPGLERLKRIEVLFCSTIRSSRQIRHRVYSQFTHYSHTPESKRNGGQRNENETNHKTKPHTKELYRNLCALSNSNSNSK